MSAVRQEAGPAGPEPTHPRRHGRVFALGVTGMAGVVLVAGGLTWASQGENPDAMTVASAGPQASAAAAAEAKEGECGMVIDGRPKTLPVPAVRRITMVAAVGQQVRAPEIQTARAIDAALAVKDADRFKVTDALALLAKHYADPASEASMAQLRILSTPGGMTCTFPAPKAAKEKKGWNGLTPRASWLRSSVLDAFGKVRVGGYVGQGSTAPKAGLDKPADEAARAGRAFDVLFSPVTDEARVRGWALAHWVVAEAGKYHVSAVTYDGWRWSAKDGAGWKPLPAPKSLPTAVPDAQPAPAPSAAAIAQSVAAQYFDRVHVTLATGR